MVSLRWRGSKRLSFIQGGKFLKLEERAFPGVERGNLKKKGGD
jgi:hypothetical protein